MDSVLAIWRTAQRTPVAAAIGMANMIRRSRVGCGIVLVAAALVLGLVPVRSSAAESASGDINVTLKSDGEHCSVRNVTIVCADLAAHLRDTLKLPAETMIHLRAGRAASYQSVKKVIDIIKQSGFRYPVAHVTEPKSSGGQSATE